MTNDPALIVEFPTASTLDQNLRRDPPAALGRGEVVLVRLDVDGSGRLAAPPIGEVLLSVPSPETLPREPDELRRVIDGAPRGDEPLIILVEEAESLRDEELSPILDAAKRARRSVIMRVLHVPSG
jgi:hypothetical protein